MDVKGKKGKKFKDQRELESDENIYLVQASWKDSAGKLTLMEKKKSMITHHPNIRETQSDPISSPRLRRPNNLVSRVRRFSRSLYQSGVGGFGGVSEGQIVEGQPQTPMEIVRESLSDGDVDEDKKSDDTK